MITNSLAERLFEIDLLLHELSFLNLVIKLLLLLSSNSKQDSSRLFTLIFFLDLFEVFMDKFLKFLSITQQVVSLLRYVPVVFQFGELGVLHRAIRFWADDFAPLELEEESFALIIKDLLIDIINLVSLNQLNNIEISRHQLFSFLKQLVLFLSYGILEWAAFTETIAAETAFAEKLNNSVNHVFPRVGP